MCTDLTSYVLMCAGLGFTLLPLILIPFLRAQVRDLYTSISIHLSI